MAVETAEPPAKIRPDTGNRVDLMTRTKAKNLYFFHEASHERIATETGLTIQAVGKLISYYGWAKEKKERVARLSKAHDARLAGMDSEIVDAIASASEEHAIRGLAKVGESLERNDRDAARDFQSYTAGVKNLASLAKALREPAANLDGAQTLNLNLFFVPAVVPAPQAEVKQVTEIESKPT